MGKLKTSNKRWHAKWFYLKNDASSHLTRFTGRLVMEAPGTWSWGTPDKEKKRLKGYFRALQQLHEAGLNGCGIICAYHRRRIALLMAQNIPLYRMVEGADLSVTMMLSEGIDVVEVCSD